MRRAALLSAAVLAAAACASDPASDAQPTTTADAASTFLGDGSLGTVVVESGEAVQIRSFESLTGQVQQSGTTRVRSVTLAIDDYGLLRGFEVDLGTPVDDLCSEEGGDAGARAIGADADVIGVIGTSCSIAATAAAPILTSAGMVMISAGNTSPALTSDLAGNPGEYNQVGYYRTSHNDLHQGTAMAQFAIVELGLGTAAAVHDGDPFTQGLAESFASAFERMGGTVNGVWAVEMGEIDVGPVLTEIGATEPEMLFMPVFEPTADQIAALAREIDGLKSTVLSSGDGLLHTVYQALPQAEGMYFSGPDTRYRNNINASTGRSAPAVLGTYTERYGEQPQAKFWAHAYDATVLLLDAISAASYVNSGGSLVIDRQGVRDYLNSVRAFNGLSGTLSCDDFGDCSAARIAVVQNLGPDQAEASLNNVVFSYAP